MYTEEEETALREIVPKVNHLLETLKMNKLHFSPGYSKELEACLEKTKTGKIIRKKFGDYMVILTVVNARDDEGNILRVFCSVDKQGHFLSLTYNFISEEQANLIRKESA